MKTDPLDSLEAENERLRNLVAGGHCIRDDKDGLSPCERAEARAERAERALAAYADATRAPSTEGCDEFSNGEASAHVFWAYFLEHEAGVPKELCGSIPAVVGYINALRQGNA